MVDISEHSPRDILSFLEWTEACGVQKIDGVQLVVNKDGRNFKDIDFNLLTTTQNLQGGQPVVMVPNPMIITGTKARQEFGPQHDAEALLQRLGNNFNQLPQFYIFLKILREYELGANSPWYPWFNSLPRYFSNGSSMTHFCCKLLPPLVGSLVNDERIRFRQFYKALDYVNDNVGLSGPIKTNKALAKWAYAVTYTRSFPIPGDGGDVQIVPLIDYCNHGSEIHELELQSDEQGNCYAVATYDVPAGTPLRLSYADESTNPSFLFARYGFVDEESPATFCKIMINREEITSQLVDMGYDHSRMLFGKNGEISQEVYDVVLYRILGEMNVKDQQRFYTAHTQGDYDTKQSIHSRYYQDYTYVALLNHIDTFLYELEKLAEKTVGRDAEITHPRLPLILKHNEFVKQTFLKVKSRLLLQSHSQSGESSA